MSGQNKKAALKHPEYFFFDGDITIRVEDSVFRVHKHFLTRESKHFKDMLFPVIPCRDPPGSSETNPVVLDDATSEGFAGLLWVFYNREYSIYNASIEKWKGILNLAQKWFFFQVEKLCIRELEKLSIPPVEKIRIYQDFKLDPNYLHGSYVALTIRDEPIDLEEGEQLGLPTSLKVAQARELARRARDSPTAQLQESEVESVIKSVFGLQGSVSAPTTPPKTPPPQPAPGAGTSYDHIDKTTAKSRRNKV